MIPRTLAGAPPRSDTPLPPAGSPVLVLGIVALTATALYFGREFFVPLALAMLLSFALAPPVRWLRRLHMPRILAVLLVVALAFMFILSFAGVVAWQVADLAGGLPRYQYNIERKVEALRAGPPGGRLFERASAMLRDIGRKIDAPDEHAATGQAPAGGQTPAASPDERRPIPVEVHTAPATPMERIEAIAAPLLGGLATAGIVIVFVIFMLLEREDLRDRLIRLAGQRDLPRTTKALDDAAQRVGHYLLMQLLVNSCYGVPIGIGLWLIGVPNPILWGMLATVLRFVPYIGAIISSFFPLALAIAVDPGWTTVLWTAALLATLELLVSNVVEPWLYGASTGLSPIAIIVAAIFWTWLWGSIGLLLSTPLTVCLVVLGRHVPQLAFLDVLLGNQPALQPAETLYQRLLVGDPDEATERAEDFMRENSLLTFYDEIGLAALVMSENDRARGSLDDERLTRVAEGMLELVENLGEIEDTPESRETDARETAEAIEEADAQGRAELARAEPSDGRLVLCAGARGILDEAAAAMLAQLLARQTIPVQLLPSESLHSAKLRELEVNDVGVVILSYVGADSLAHPRFLVRRLRRRFPDAKILLGFWSFGPEDMAHRDPATATGADHVATSLTEAIALVSETLSPDVAEATPAAPVLALAAGGER